MAIEAARQQSQIAEPCKPGCLRLSEVQFWEPLKFSAFRDSEATIEVHLRARKRDESNLYSFEILSITADEPQGSKKHCSGQFGWTDTRPESRVLSSDVLHDQHLLQQSLGHDDPLISRLENFALTSSGISGSFKTSLEFPNVGLVDPLVFESILGSLPLMLSGRNLPATYKISSIHAVVVPATPPDTPRGHFRVVSNGETALGGRCNISIKLDDSHITVSDVIFEADKLVHEPPALKSLYFKPITLPDISRMAPCNSLSISECLKLVTHKWPMCNIAAIDTTTEDLSEILESLSGAQPGERPRFRSFQLIGEATGFMSDRVRVVDTFIDSTKFHLMFAGNITNLDGLGKLILPNAIVCINTRQKEVNIQVSSSLSKICDVVGIGKDLWTLFRAQPDQIDYGSAPNLTIFACPSWGSNSVSSIEVDEYVHLTPLSVKNFCERKQERYSAIVIDENEKSIITTWPGNDLVPWLQNLLEYADNIMWVTKQKESNPFTNIAGSLLRTIQSEQPSIKVTWLVLSDDPSESTIQESVDYAYASLVSGENEIKLDISNATTSILRYLADDELSASMGLIPPQSNHVSLIDRDYKISLSSRETPILLAFDQDRVRDVDPEKIQVGVEASIVDSVDILAYNGKRPNHSNSTLGTFFAGRVISELSEKFPQGSKIVGFAYGGHSKILDVASKQVQMYSETMSPPEAGATFACIATALSIVDGTARARRGDTVELTVRGGLKQAIRSFGNEIGLIFLTPGSAKSADFVITSTKSDGLRVNGASVNIGDYLGSERGTYMIAQEWNKKLEPTEPLKVFELADYDRAFRTAQKNPYSVALLHENRNAGKVLKSALMYKKAARLLTGDGAYIIIGGLGGLGRFVCRWMVEKGAKRIIAISRSGVKSDEARQTWEAINAMGIAFEVIRADACDREAMSQALAGIRKTCAIKGIINMAMLLGDAPMAVMEGWQWDIALRLKIDSSWIMHEETSDDPLEFFIMFSSIASVLGNRNQGGYNVGNTFLNALAEYRRSMGRTAISIALGAMSKYFLPIFFTRDIES